MSPRGFDDRLSAAWSATARAVAQVDAAAELCVDPRESAELVDIGSEMERLYRRVGRIAQQVERAA